MSIHYSVNMYIKRSYKVCRILKPILKQRFFFFLSSKNKQNMLPQHFKASREGSCFIICKKQGELISEHFWPQTKVL